MPQRIAQFRAGQPVVTTGILQGIVTLLDTLIVNPDNALYDKTDDEVYPPQVAAKLPGLVEVRTDRQSAVDVDRALRAAVTG